MKERSRSVQDVALLLVIVVGIALATVTVYSQGSGQQPAQTPTQHLRSWPCSSSRRGKPNTHADAHQLVDGSGAQAICLPRYRSSQYGWPC